MALNLSDCWVIDQWAIQMHHEGEEKVKTFYRQQSIHPKRGECDPFPDPGLHKKCQLGLQSEGWNELKTVFQILTNGGVLGACPPE